MYLYYLNTDKTNSVGNHSELFANIGVPKKQTKSLNLRVSYFLRTTLSDGFENNLTDADNRREVRYQNKKLRKTLQNDNNTRQYDNNILQKFSKIR